MELKNGKELIVSKALSSEAGEIIQYLNLIGGESDNLLFGANEFHMSLEAEEEFINSMNQSNKSALLVGRIDGELVCMGSIQSPTRQRLTHQGNIAISVKKKFWNMGVGTELMKVLINFAQDTNAIEILHLGVRSDNINAIKLYKKLGFVEIGVYRNFFKINGDYADEILMNLYLSRQ